MRYALIILAALALASPAFAGGHHNDAATPKNQRPASPSVWTHDPNAANLCPGCPGDPNHGNPPRVDEDEHHGH